MVKTSAKLKVAKKKKSPVLKKAEKLASKPNVTQKERQLKVPKYRTFRFSKKIRNPKTKAARRF